MMESQRRLREVPKSRPRAEVLVGTLPDWAIKEHIRNGVIQINPLPDNWEDKIDQVSMDFRLGNEFRRLKRNTQPIIDTKFMEKEDLEDLYDRFKLADEQPLVLRPNEGVIITTKERLTLPDNIVGRLDGKSRWARLFIQIHETSARFDPGYDGNPVLEILMKEDKEILLYPGTKICAFSFEQLSWSVDNPYGGVKAGRYGGSTPQLARIE